MTSLYSPNDDSVPPFYARGRPTPLPYESGSARFPASAPYRVSFLYLEYALGFTAERAAVLAGFRAYRRALRACGVACAVQWVGGAFLDLSQSSPDHLMVATFLNLDDADGALARRLGFPAEDDNDMFRARLLRCFSVDARHYGLAGAEAPAVLADVYPEFLGTPTDTPSSASHTLRGFFEIML
jgi:hypothetical protein